VIFGGQLKVILLKDIASLVNKLETAHDVINTQWFKANYVYYKERKPNVTDADLNIWTARAPHLRADLQTVFEFSNEEQ
jgi:hypothetical protein